MKHLNGQKPKILMHDMNKRCIKLIAMFILRYSYFSDLIIMENHDVLMKITVMIKITQLLRPNVSTLWYYAPFC